MVTLKRLVSTLSVVTILVLSGVTIGLYEAFTNPIFAVGTSTSISATSASFSGTSAFENITSSTGSLKSPASVIVFKSGASTYWKNATTGAIGYSSSISALAIQNALNSMTSGGTLNIDSSIATIANTINVTRNHIDFTFQPAGGDISDGSQFIDCTANPCFNVTGAYVSFTRGDFKTSVAGTNIFKVLGVARVKFDGQNFFASSGISRDILPYYVKVTDNFIDVKISNVYASAKNFMKIEKSSTGAVTRSSIAVSDVAWRTDGNGGTGFNITANTLTLQNIFLNNIYAFFSTSTFINMTSVNNGAISYVTINNVRSQTNNGIYMNGGTGTGYVSAIDINNAEIDVPAASSFGIKAVGIVHSIQGNNIGLSFGAGAGAIGLDLEPSSNSGPNGKSFFFSGVRVYDTLGTQTSIKTNLNVSDSKIIGESLYLQYSSISSGSNVTISSPYSERNYLSSTFAIDSTGYKNITITHGLQLTPYLQDIQVTVVENTHVNDWNYSLLKVQSVTSTTITITIKVSGASVTGGATAKLSVRVNPSN